jgi:glycerophosphoryl diester phosphodiesterase
MRSSPSMNDLELARHYAPVLILDGAEPFLPSRVGYTIFREVGASPSFPRYVRLEPPASLAIEYAIWWDWDIGHLYELEHAWVFVGDDGEIVRVESSQHGGAYGGDLNLEGGRPVLYSEPGKHALAHAPSALAARRGHTERSCSAGAGGGGVWVTPLYRGRIPKTPDDDQLVRTYLRRRAFTPRWDWSLRVDTSELPAVPWQELDASIPGIVRARLNELDAEIPREERHVLHVGHRGASAHAPENTLAAIRKAAELGAHMVELDVRMSADGVPVLSHDAAVSMPGRGRVPVTSLTAGELQMSTSSPETSVPTLEAALDLCVEVHVKPYLEIKEGETVAQTVAALSGRGLGRYSAIGSFEPAWVARATDLAPHIPTSILFGSFEADPVALARGCGASYVHPCWERHPAPHMLLTPEWLARVRSEGLGVVCWHEERPDVLRALLRMGVSAVCTDRLDLIRDVAAELPWNAS